MKHFRNPQTDEEIKRVPPRQRLANGFPVLTYGETPQVSLENWAFNVWGEAEPLTLRWDALMGLPQREFRADFHCVTHWSKLNVQWRGVEISDVMEQIDLTASAQYVLVHCYGGYTTNLTLEDLTDPGVFLAHTLHGEVLPSEHGGPVRLVVPHLYAWKSAKWISGLEFLAVEKLGFWEENGYHRRGNPWQQERYS